MNFKGLLAMLAVAALVVTMAGCNTFKGVAKDIDAGATATQDAIDDATSDE